MIDTVLLVRPYAAGKKELPINLLYIGTALKNCGFKVVIIDLQDTPGKEEEIISTLFHSPNAILGISSLAPHYHWVKNFTLKVKSQCPKTPIIIGGHIAISYEILLNHTGVDYVCLKEGEETLPELINRLNRNMPPEEVAGLAFKKNGAIIQTAWRHPLITFLLPDYSLINAERYFIHPNKDQFFKRSNEYQKRAKADDKLGVIMFSRGCIGYCGFCYRHLPGFRQGSIDWSWKHLMILYQQYGVRYFRIDDELFTNNPEWLKAFYEKIKNSKIDIMFRITGLRVDLVTDEQLMLLKDMGCIAVNYGIESGSQQILDNMKKGVTVEVNKTALKKTLASSMQAMAYIIVGYQGENRTTINQTMNMLLECKLPPEYVSLFYAVPLPGTKLYHDCIKQGKITNEEGYLDSLYQLVEKRDEVYQYYLINVSDLRIIDLIQAERDLFLLLKLRLLIDNQRIFNLLREIVLSLPACRLNIFLARFFYRSLNFLELRLKRFKYGQS